MGCTLSPLRGLEKRLILSEFPHPDVAEAEGRAGVAVGLEFDRSAVEGFVEGRADVASLAFELEVVLHEHSIEKDGDVGGRFQPAVGVEDGSGPGNVVGLPFAGLAIWVGERDGLFVDAAGLAVDVCFVVVVVEHLQFVAGIAGAGGGEKTPLLPRSWPEPVTFSGIFHST